MLGVCALGAYPTAFSVPRQHPASSLHGGESHWPPDSFLSQQARVVARGLAGPVGERKPVVRVFFGVGMFLVWVDQVVAGVPGLDGDSIFVSYTVISRRLKPRATALWSLGSHWCWRSAAQTPRQPYILCTYIVHLSTCCEGVP